MLDTKFLRDNLAAVRQALTNRGYQLSLEPFQTLDAQRRKLLVEMETLRARQHQASDQIARLKRQGQDAADVLREMRGVSQQVKTLAGQLEQLEQQLTEVVWVIPNMPHASVPVGPATANQVVRTWGEPARFSFKPQTHLELGASLKLLDLERAAKITGSHFPLFTGRGALLERALITFMLDVHTTEHGYTEIFPPFLVNRLSMTGTGQLPKFEADMYRLQDDDLFLVPTAEVPVTNLYRDEILDETQLPLCHAAYTACFRREAGSYGQETRGMVRVHQFDKVELVKFTTPQSSYEEHEKLLQNAETILQRLGLPYRVVLLATGDLSFAAAKCYDLEAWAPGIGTWLEVSSCSNFEAFQARRINIRYRPKGSTKTALVHTLNGSGIALARTVIALLEYHQQPDGSVVIPEPLRPYMKGLDRLGPA